MVSVSTLAALALYSSCAGFLPFKTLIKTFITDVPGKLNFLLKVNNGSVLLREECPHIP